ncbi:hypothetical protein Scep_017866 [Stephania cephalantha]|uniref:Sirohydrochlorin ferrochelatase n=1 Tax=Stephania cephalantha TaxID=152367 RepID=A0AAP0IQA8_9MAGN
MEATPLSSQFTLTRVSNRETIRNSGLVFPHLANPHRIPALRRNLLSVRSSSITAQNGGGFRREKHRLGAKDGVIVVDHGSRRKESNLMLNEFVAMFRERTGYPIVEPAHMELAEPSIKHAFDSCVRQGANRIIISPYFLFPGRHWHQDIPQLTAEAAKEHPGVSYMITAPIGLHEQMVDVVNDTINRCLSHVEGDADECVVCSGTGKCRLYETAKHQ